MSWRATSWAAEQRTGAPISKLVLLKLADNANDEGICWPSVPLIAEHTELSERTVQEHLKRLEAIGLIFIERRQGPSGVNLPNIYHLAMPSSTKRGKVVQEPHHGDGAAAAPVVQPARTMVHEARGMVQETASHIDEPTSEPSGTVQSRAGEDVHALRARVWSAFQSWQGDLPSSASEASTLGALDRLENPPPLPELIAAIELEGEAILARNSNRGGMGRQPLMAPHNWLTKVRGWEKHLPEVRARPARVADGVDRAARVMATLGAEVHARLRRARLSEEEIASLDGALFIPGPPAAFRDLTVQQERTLRAHHQRLNEIWPGILFDVGARRTTA